MGRYRGAACQAVWYSWRLMSVNYLHTMIRVRDLDASIAFYQQAFGYQLRSRRPGPDDREIAFLQLPGETSELQLSCGTGHMDFSVREGIMHLAFRVDDMDATRAAAIAAGASPVKGPYELPSGSKVAFLADPDGFSIELVQKPS